MSVSKKVEDLIAKIVNTNPYENLESILGKELGSLIYKLIEELEK